MKSKKTFFYLLGVAVLVLVTILVLNVLAERKIAGFLQAKLETNQLAYGEIDVDVIFGTIEIDSVLVEMNKSKIQLDHLKINNIHYWDFLMNDKINIDRIYLDSPIISRRSIQKKNKRKKGDGNFKKYILIKSFEVENGKYVLLKNRSKDTLLLVKNISGGMDSLKLNQQTLEQKIPFEYGAYSFKADSLYFDMNKYHELSIEQFLVSDKQIAFQQLFLRPKYSRSEFREIIPYEKDMYRLKIDSLEIQQPSFDFVANEPVFKTDLMVVDGVEFKIYRDKTVQDDPRTKKMYSEMLRDLSLKLDIKRLELKDVFLQYQERIKKGRPPGIVAFYDLSASVENITNINLNSENFPLTQLKIHAKFMNTTDLDVKWQFDISDQSEWFTISGSANKIPPRAINPFFVPALHIRAEGSIDALYFNFRGNQVEAIGDMKMNYNNFSVTVLKENGEEKNKFLTTIANIFVNDSPKDDTVVKKGIKVKRDLTKSFWNYFWSMIEKGVLKSVL